MKKITLAITLMLICKFSISQTVLTDTSKIFNKNYELSGLTISDNKFYFISEKCGEIFVGSYNYYMDGWKINFDSLPFKNSELEGICFYQNPILFVCDEKNAKIIVVNIAYNTAKEVAVDVDFSAWRGNTGMEGITIDKKKNQLFLLREKDGNGNSEICVFDIFNNNENFSLKIRDTIILKHSNTIMRYSDIFYNSKKEQLLLIRSNYFGECNGDNEYFIDTINTKNLFPKTSSKAKKEFNSDKLMAINISDTINSYCNDYNTNMEGITVDGENIYLVSDNATTDAPQCDRSDKKSLFIRINKRH